MNEVIVAKNCLLALGLLMVAAIISCALWRFRKYVQSGPR